MNPWLVAWVGLMLGVGKRLYYVGGATPAKEGAVSPTKTVAAVWQRGCHQTALLALAYVGDLFGGGSQCPLCRHRRDVLLTVDWCVRGAGLTLMATCWQYLLIVRHSRAGRRT